MSPSVRDALASVRLIRARLDQVSPTVKLAILGSLSTIEAALKPEEATPAPVIVPQSPTLNDLERAVVRCALEERRLRLHLQGAPRRAQMREGLQSTISLDAAVEALAEHETKNQLEQVRANATSKDRAS